MVHFPKIWVKLSTRYFSKYLLWQILQQLDEKLRERDEDDPHEVFNDWCAGHAASQFPGMWIKAIAVPPSILSVSPVKVLETPKTNSVSFFTVQGQESDQKGRQAMIKVFAAFCVSVTSSWSECQTFIW